MNPLHVLMAPAEYAPFAKVGGLGDVTAALAAELASRGHQVRVVLPLYGHLDRRGLDIRPVKKWPPLSLRVGQRIHDIRYHVLGRGAGRLRVYFVECEALFDRPGIYTTADGTGFPDSLERAAIHAQAALLLPRLMSWSVDILHAHDAHDVPLVLYRKFWYPDHALLGQAATVLTIHNLAYQEIHLPAAAETLGLPAGLAVYPGLLEFHGRINLMKAGIMTADRVNTVSPTYAQETRSNPELGCDLQHVLNDRGRSYSGILNGIDEEVWDPRQDPALAAAFGPGDLGGKQTCRGALMKELGLKDTRGPGGRPARPLCGFVGRLVTQKGMGLLLPLLPRLTADGFTFAIQGTGEPELEQAMREAAASHRGGVAYCDRYDDGLAHRIYAGCDAFLMPSLFEPCGLSQMYALRYGSPPVVRRTGGLADTVVGEPDPSATGFMFTAARSEALLACLRHVEKTWLAPAAWDELMTRGMACDFGWKAAIERYEALYSEALGDRKER